MEFDKKRGYLVLIDPDKQDPKVAGDLAKRADKAGADAIMVGSSITLNDSLSKTVSEIKKQTNLPVVLFPGGAPHVCAEADDIFFMSLISGRNPEFLIGAQVIAAPTIMKYNLKVHPMAYILVNGGKMTSVEFMSNTKPLPEDKPDIAVAHALAAKYLGFELIYLEAGSGAKNPVPNEMIKAVKKYVPNIPLIVGGGIRDAETAKEKYEAGANYVVTGNAIEKDPSLMDKIAALTKNL